MRVVGELPDSIPETLRKKKNVNDSPAAVFERLVRPDLPADTPVLFDTVCVLGGSIAGLMAARVLSDHSRRILIVERDEVDVEGHARAGVPHGQQVHGLRLGGLRQFERWLPGFTAEARNQGAVLLTPEQNPTHLDERELLPIGSMSNLFASRPFFEARIRERVLSLPNVETTSAQVTGLEFRDDAVRAVRFAVGDAEDTVDVDFAVDAMGRASRLSDWLEHAGYDRPRLHRLRTGVNYTSAIFTRDEKTAGLDPGVTALVYSPGSRKDHLGLAIVMAIENDQWMVALTAFGDTVRPDTLEEFRAYCAELPGLFPKATSGNIVRGPVRFRQSDSRYRDFTGLSRFPARLVSLGDSVASLTAAYGQGLSSAALQASALSEYLTHEPELDRSATEFFALQKVVIDALWAAGEAADTAWQDVVNESEVADEVQRRRWESGQLVQASLVDPVIAEKLDAVGNLYVHPLALADPALLERAIAVNQQHATSA